MLKKWSLYLVLLLCPFAAGHVYGFESRGQDCSKCHTLSNDEASNLIRGIFPDVRILDIRLSPPRTSWEISAESGGRKGLLYVDFSKRYLFLGSILSINERRNLTQDRLTELNKVDVSQIPLEDALIMGDPKAKIRVIVFDDPD